MDGTRDKDGTVFGLPRVDVAEPLGLLLACQLVLFVGVGAVIPTLPLYGKAIGLSSSVNGIVIAAPAAALLVGAAPAGSFADRARKPAMIGGMLLTALADAGTAASRSLVPLLVARLALGAGRCISESGERGMLADLAGRAPELRGRALSAQQAVCALGIAIGAPIGGAVVDVFGAPAAFLCVSAAASACALGYVLLPETLPAVAEAEAAAPAPPEVDVWATWGELLRDARWRGLAACEMGARVGFAAKVAAVPVLAARVLPGGVAGAGALLSAAGLAGLVGAPVGGWLTDRVGARATAGVSGLVSGGALLAIPLALGAGRATADVDGPLGGLSVGGAAFAALVVLWGMAVAAQGPALTALGQQLAPKDAQATALAFPRAAADGMYVVAPFALGLITDATSTTGAECGAAGLAVGLGAMALLVLS